MGHSRRHGRKPFGQQVLSQFENGPEGTGLAAKGAYGVIMLLLICISAALLPIIGIVWVVKKLSRSAPTPAITAGQPVEDVELPKGDTDTTDLD